MSWTITNVPCQHCHRLQDEHVGGKCLFSTQMYLAFADGVLLMSLRKQNDLPGDPRYDHMHFYEFFENLLAHQKLMNPFAQGSWQHWGVEIRSSQYPNDPELLRMLEIARTVSIQALGR